MPVSAECLLQCFTFTFQYYILLFSTVLNLFACEVARLEDDCTLHGILDLNLNYAVVFLVKISSELLPFS